jgi:hypothetical protein
VQQQGVLMKKMICSRIGPDCTEKAGIEATRIMMKERRVQRMIVWDCVLTILEENYLGKMNEWVEEINHHVLQ